MADLSKEYTAALFALAMENGLVDEFKSELGEINDSIDEEYILILKSPAISLGARLNIIEEAFGARMHEYIVSFMKLLCENGATLKGILLTHGHFDHTVTVDTIRNKYPIELMMHSGDAPMMSDGKLNGFYDFYGQESTHRPAERLLEDGDVIKLGNSTLTIISTPGHSPGSICILCESEGETPFMITGDTLFSNSVGRWDLWGGDQTILARSLSLLNN